MATDDRELLSTFNLLFKDEEEDVDIRTEAFVGMMKLHGLNSVQIAKRNNNKIVFSISDIHLEEFSDELLEIDKIIS